MRPHELKLLIIFDVIMTENSITRAAEQLSMTQPAVSNAVSRMRVLWKDELFVADGRNIQATSYARNLWMKTRDQIYSLNQALTPDEFDPKTAKRTFRIALPDIVLDTLWTDMRLLFELEAPQLNLYALPYTIGATSQLLDDAEVDLVIGQSNRSLKNICSEHLFDTSYVCAMRKGHPLSNSALSIEAFAAAEHLLISLSGDASSPVDHVLHQSGLSRRIAFTVNHFASAVPVIKRTDLIAILPTDLVHRYLEYDELSIIQPPLDVPHTSISMLWHKRQSADEGLIWLCKHIKKILVESRARQVNAVNQFYNL